MDSQVDIDISNWEPSPKRRKVIPNNTNDMPEVPADRFYNPNLEEMFMRGNDENRQRKREKVLGTCRIYRKQDEAMREVQKIFRKNEWLVKLESTDHHRVFCFEMDVELIPLLQGFCQNCHEIKSFIQTRYFLLCTFRTFYKHYKTIPYEHRHFYEVIAGGFPCHLYFDIERPQFKVEDYEGREKHMMKLFQGLILEEIQRELHIHIGHRSIPVVDLISSTDKKVSHHVIIKLDEGKVIFRNNDHMKNFVKNFIASLRLKIESGEGDDINNYLFYDVIRTSRDGNSTKTIRKCVVDDGVYTKNRHFRLLYSCKKTDPNSDKPRRTFIVNKDETIKRYQTIDRRELQPSDEEFFYSSLITNVDLGYEDKLFIHFKPEDCKSLEKLKEIEDKRNQVNMPEMKIQDTTLLVAEPPPMASCVQYGKRNRLKDREKVLIMDFPHIVTFVIGFWNQRGNVNSSARGIEYYPKTKVLDILVGGPNRWCDNVRRHHRSNHVHLIVKVAEKRFYQKCFDDDCKGFKSREFLIPDNCMDTIPRRFQGEM